MEKKNKYVMTIGFNRHDPKHRGVAEFLNGMSRGKADYIVKAIVAYGRTEQNGDEPGQSDHNSAGQKNGGIDYEQIRKYVLQVLEEQGKKIRYNTAENVTEAKMRLEEQYGKTPDEFSMDNELLEDTWGGIMESLISFRQ